MRKPVFLIGVAMLAATATGASAQGYDWGSGGTCIGYGCIDGPYDRPVRGGYRAVRTYEDYDVRPGIRVYERRVYRSNRHDDDWDDDDDLD